MKTTRQQFLKIVAEYSASLDVDSETFGTLNIDAPLGKVWSANDCHTISEPFANNGGQSWKSEAYTKAIERMAYGLRDCASEDCDICKA